MSYKQLSGKKYLAAGSRDTKPIMPGLIALFAGLLMLLSHQSSLLKMMLHSPQGMAFCFLFCTSSLIYALWGDFSRYRNLALNVMLSVLLVAASVLVLNPLLVWGFNIYAICNFLSAIALVQSDRSSPGVAEKLIRIMKIAVVSSIGVYNFIAGAWSFIAFFILEARDAIKEGKVKSAISIESSIVVAAILAWACSSLTLMMPSVFAFGVVFHDSLLAIGAYQIGCYFRDRYRDRLTASGDDYPQVWVDGKEKDIRQLKSNDIFTLKEGADYVLPFPITGREGALVTKYQPNNEVRISMAGNKVSIPAFCSFNYQKGELVAKGVFQPARRSAKVTGESFFGWVILISLVAGLLGGLYTQSVLSGFAQFALSIMGACPCVFVFSRPIIELGALSYAHRKGLAFADGSQQSIWYDKIDIIAFDRTHTLYQPKINEQADAPYRLIEYGRECIDSLRSLGKDIWVISGTEREGCADAIAKELNIDREKIMTSVSDKQSIIKNLKSYGHNDPLKGSKGQYRVMFVGDGENDHNALESSDLAVALGENHQTQAKAHLRIQKDQIPLLTNLNRLIDATSKWLSNLTGAAYVYNICMLFLANGGFFLMFGMALPISYACLSMMCFSFLTLWASSQFDPSVIDQKVFNRPSSELNSNVPIYQNSKRLVGGQPPSLKMIK